ncbi:TetR/AcrR family transcriptional regulator [Thalassotalea sediminis]|uniref:TetR/AcrR family transcriptional regulator n=1 Tax=Thalassotalea sediminis TaxID=1759089 RepID=UPI0025722B7A|nr:TetR family transcriptional regulator [Thalassotalea sediminis]
MSLIKEKNVVKRRSKGEQTRNQILNAAIEVLAANGIKGTTHRAIANQAQLQLSLTTYYFKDIQELVHEAFLLSSNRTLEKARLAWLQIFELLDSYTKTQLKKGSIRRELADTLSKIATDYLINKLKENPVDLAVEQFLFTEVQVSPALRQLATSHRDTLIAPFERLCGYFSPETATIDADILLTVFTQLEYRNLVAPKAVDVDYIYSIVERLLMAVLRVKRKSD